MATWKDIRVDKNTTQEEFDKQAAGWTGYSWTEAKAVLEMSGRPFLNVPMMKS